MTRLASHRNNRVNLAVRPNPNGSAAIRAWDKKGVSRYGGMAMGSVRPVGSVTGWRNSDAVGAAVG